MRGIELNQSDRLPREVSSSGETTGEGAPPTPVNLVLTTNIEQERAEGLHHRRVLAVRRMNRKWKGSRIQIDEKRDSTNVIGCDGVCTALFRFQARTELGL